MKQVVYNVVEQVWEFYIDSVLVKTLSPKEVGSRAQIILEELEG